MPGQLLDMTPREFFNAVHGYAEQLEQDSKERWEQARLVAYYSIAAHIKKGKSMAQLIPLPWDKAPDKGPRPSDEEIEAMKRRILKSIPGWQTQLARS